jgi:hypothetical protein
MPYRSFVTVRVSRRTALQLGIAGIIGTALAACSKSSSAGSKMTPLNQAKLASFIIGTWDLSITQDLHDPTDPPHQIATGTIDIAANGWTLTLGKGLQPGATPIPFTLDGNASGSWQPATNTVTITMTYGNGPAFGEQSGPFWSTLVAGGLSGSPTSGELADLSWNPTLSGSDTDMIAHPGTLAVHIKTSRQIALTHTMNPPSDPNIDLDKTTTTITATKR